MSSTSASAGSNSSTNRAPAPAATITNYRAEYRQADLFLQEVQSFVDLAGVPALNELRNAGKHLIDSLDDDGSVIDVAQLTAAIAHCRRACYEAYEAGILAALGVVHKFRTDYSTTPVEAVIPDYVAILRKARDAQRSVEIGRHPEFDREQDHRIRMQAFRDLRECADRLSLGREEMNKKVAGDRKRARLVLYGVIFAAAAVAAAILGLIWQATDFWVPWDTPAITAPGKTE